MNLANFSSISLYNLITSLPSDLSERRCKCVAETEHMFSLSVLSSLELSWLSFFDSGPCTCHIQEFLDICIQWLALELNFLFEKYAFLARGWFLCDLSVLKFSFVCELMEIFGLVRQSRLPKWKAAVNLHDFMRLVCRGSPEIHAAHCSQMKKPVTLDCL